MENTKMLGLCLTLFVLQFTDRSFVHGQFLKFSHDPPILANEMSTQVRSKIDPDALIYALRNVHPVVSEIGVDLEKQRFKFIENLKMFTEPLDNLKRAAGMVFNGNAEKEAKNYVKLVSALDRFVNHTMCDPTKLKNKLAYIAITSLAMAEANLAPQRVASRILEIIEDHESKIKDLKSTILHVTTTSCLFKTTESCNEKIYKSVFRSDILLAEATILAKYADLAQYYQLNFHDEFIRVSKADKVYSFLLKSLSHLTPLLENIIATRMIAGINVSC